MRRVVIIGYDSAELLDIACPSDVFDAANRLGATPAYDVSLVTLDGRPVSCSSGLSLAAHARLDQVDGPLDTVIVAGGLGHEKAAADDRLIRGLRGLAGRARRVASVCTGATVLAAAGLLRGRRATTHWRWAPMLAARHPDVTVDPAPLFVKDEHVYTSAGVTSALDLTLAFVEEDHGPSMARDISRYLVTYLQRPASQAQVSMFVSGPAPEHRLVRDLAGYIGARLGADLSTRALAARAGISVRQLSRLFESQLRMSPRRYVSAVRTEAAAQLLASTDLPLETVAQRCGLGTTSTLRKAILDAYGVTPSTYRRTHRGLVATGPRAEAADPDAGQSSGMPAAAASSARMARSSARAVASAAARPSPSPVTSVTTSK